MKMNRHANIVTGMAGLMGAVLLSLPAFAQDMEECFEHVTGGGWIDGTPSGGSANFGVGGGVFDDGTRWGHLNYVDQDADLHVVWTEVTGYSTDPNDSNCRFIEYNVRINGEPGQARVRVCDYDEPGWEDTFEIRLSTGYVASGDLDGEDTGGGNIQLHLEEDCE